MLVFHNWFILYLFSFPKILQSEGGKPTQRKIKTALRPLKSPFESPNDARTEVHCVYITSKKVQFLILPDINAFVKSEFEKQAKNKSI